MDPARVTDGRYGTAQRTTLELGPNHFATGLSTDSPGRFQGFHEKNILFVVDEASGVREEVFEAIEGSMTSRRVRLLLIGIPTALDLPARPTGRSTGSRSCKTRYGPTTFDPQESLSPLAGERSQAHLAAPGDHRTQNISEHGGLAGVGG
jgi:hypothetical protein